MQAHGQAMTKIKEMIERARTRRWIFVSQALAKLLPKKEIPYTHGACQKRFEDIMSGIAAPPVPDRIIDEDYEAQLATRKEASRRKRLEEDKIEAEKKARKDAEKQHEQMQTA